MNLVTAKRLILILGFAAVLALGWICFGKKDLIYSVGKFSNYKKLPQRKFAPKVNKKCTNVLFNLTVGAWETLPGANVTELDLTYRNYWRQKGILKNMWREDGKCGYKNLQPKVPGSKWPAVGSWCDKDGPKPCCTDPNNGICTAPSKAACDCESCVDTRKYVYAELSQWNPNDPRCSWTPYTGSQACDVIKSSPFNDIYFVGDSLMRNMFAGFAMLLSDDPVRGAWGKQMSEKQKESCVAERFFFWDECRTVIRTLDDLVQPEKLCGGVSNPNFTATTHVFYSLTESGQFLDLMKSLIGKRGSLLLVGVGGHMKLQAPSVANKYLGPALKVRDDFYENTNVSLDSRWPRVVFILPLLTGLLKPSEHLNYQNDIATTKFSNEMRVYCEQHDIPVFDFRPLARLAHSFDGSHYGLGVNFMKNQILLHYINEQTMLLESF